MIYDLVVVAGFVVLAGVSLIGIGMMVAALTRANELDERVGRLEEFLDDPDPGRHERKE